jgi:hypothetical protein
VQRRACVTARFSFIGGIVACDGALYISDEMNHRLRKLHDGVVSTFAGTGARGFQDGDSDVAQFRYCPGVALDSQGRLLLVDQLNHRIRAVASDGTTTTLAGTGGRGHEDGPVATATFSTPTAVLAAPDGSIYETENHSIRKIPTDGVVTKIVGSGDSGFLGGPWNDAISILLWA